MKENKLPEKITRLLNNFSQGMKSIYGEELISLILYGSASSGEFVHQHSDLNVLVILKDSSLMNLEKSALFIKGFAFKGIEPLFLSLNEVNTSTDVFPIEFMDMKENYLLLSGEDVLASLNIDLNNLRYQCEHELKSKLFNLKKSYLRLASNNNGLRLLLLESFTSILHILRSLLRLKGINPPYTKKELITALDERFKINLLLWNKILAYRNKEIKLSGDDLKAALKDFTGDLAGIIDSIE